MSLTDAVTRVAQIQQQIASVQTAFDPPTTTSPATQSAAASGSSSFADTLAQAQAASAPGAAADVSGISGVGAMSLSPRASAMLTTDQQQFAARLSANTGLDPSVVAAWLLAEESGGAAQSRQSANNNDWLNIGYTDSATYGAGDSVWSNPIAAADATAGWLKGQNTIPGYGSASSGIQAILSTAGQGPAAQISALQQSGWASSGYPDLPALYQQVS